MPKDNPSELIRAGQLTAFDRWALPSFDPPVEALPDEPAAAPSEPEPVIEDVEVDAVKPLTLEELEAIRQDAYNEGFATGEKDGFHAGQLKARQEAEAALKPRLASLEQLLGHLLEPIAEQDRALEEALLSLVSHLAQEVIRRELTLDSSQITPVLREALKLLPMGAENICIYVNPQDFQAIKTLRERHEERWRILEDDGLLPGGCRIETEHSRIDASIETRLQQAIGQLFAQRRENTTNPPPADLIVDLDHDHAP